MSRSSQLPTVRPPVLGLARTAGRRDERAVPAPVVLPEGERLPQSETRLITRPAMAAAVHDEAWARAATGVLVVTMHVDDLKRLPLDHRTGYVLSLMVGCIDLATLADVSVIPRHEVLRIVRDLVESGVVICR